MEKLIVEGNKHLRGEVTVSGAKNAVLALLPAALLVEGVTILENVPNISDVRMICKIMNKLGAKVEFIAENTVRVDSRKLTDTHAPTDLTSKFRASYYLIGSLLGRARDVEVGLPGGCSIGVRPIDQHIKGFENLGATVTIAEGKIRALAEKLEGTEVYFDIVSVGATINLILASVLAKGTTVLYNCAKEPHVVDVANFLNRVGADIRGAGTDTIKIDGVEKLVGDFTYYTVPDQIEAGTFMIAAAATKGDVLIKNCVPEHLDPLTSKIEEMGCEVEYLGDSVRVKYVGKLDAVNVKTLPHPGFPTDLQAQMGVLLAVAEGTSLLTESVWESRFQYTDELIKMGARVKVTDRTAVFEGVERLTPANLYASDLRAGAALVIAGLIADGTSEIHNIHYIDRGYEKFEEKFNMLGANITRAEDIEEIY